MIHHSNAFYLFGGKYNSNTIAQLDEVGCPLKCYAPFDRMLKIVDILCGQMQKDRFGHGVVYDGASFLVIGGYGDLRTENCVLEEAFFACTELGPSIYNYAYYLGLFLTHDNYADNC